jgi:hypothetical protein
VGFIPSTQRLLFFFMHIHCHGEVLTQPLPNSDMRAKRKSRKYKYAVDIRYAIKPGSENQALMKENTQTQSTMISQVYFYFLKVRIVR